MKKIISLLASVAMLATVFTSVSAATLANNAPVVDTVVTQLTADEYYYDWMEEELPAGQNAYLITATVSGLDLSNKAAGTSAAKKTKRIGTLLKTSSYQIDFESTANLVAVNYMDGLGAGTAAEKTVKNGYATTEVFGGLPEVADGVTTAATATEFLLYQAVITTTGPLVGTAYSEFAFKDVDGTAVAGILNFGKSEAQQATYTVNGVSGNSIAIGSSVPAEMVVDYDNDARFDLDINEDEVADGYAWEVLITNYDSTKTLSAKFTDAETGLPRAGKEKTEITGLAAAAETDGSIEFVALLQLSQFRSVNLEIVVE